MDRKQRDVLKKAKLEHKASIKNNRTLFIDKRNELMKYLLQSPSPAWGSVKINLIKY